LRVSKLKVLLSLIFVSSYSFFILGAEAASFEPHPAAKQIRDSVKKISQKIKSYKKEESINSLREELFADVLLLSDYHLSEESRMELTVEINTVFHSLYERNHHWRQSVTIKQKEFEKLLWKCMKFKMFYIIPIFIQNDIIKDLLKETRDESGKSILYQVALACAEDTVLSDFFNKIVPHWQDYQAEIILSATVAGLRNVNFIFTKKLVDFDDIKNKLYFVRICLDLPNYALILNWLYKKSAIDILTPCPLYNHNVNQVRDNNIFQLLSIIKKPQKIKEILQFFKKDFIADISKFSSALVNPNSDGAIFCDPSFPLDQKLSEEKVYDYIHFFSSKADETEKLLWNEIRGLVQEILQQSGGKLKTKEEQDYYYCDFIAEEEKALAIDESIREAKEQQYERLLMSAEETQTINYETCQSLLKKQEKSQEEHRKLITSNLLLQEEKSFSSKDLESSLQKAQSKIENLKQHLRRQSSTQTSRKESLATELAESLREFKEEQRKSLLLTTSLKDSQKLLRQLQEKKSCVCSETQTQVFSGDEDSSESFEMQLENQKLLLQAQHTEQMHQLELRLKEKECELTHLQDKFSQGEQQFLGLQSYLAYLQNLLQEKDYDLMAKTAAMHQLQMALGYNSNY
jgi:hypothetical protein